MTSPGNGRTRLFVLVGGLAALLIMFLVILPAARVSAAGGFQPALQTTPGYEPPATDTPVGGAYPAPTSENSTATAGATSTAQGSPIPSPTLTFTPTLVPNIFKTENSEMNGALTTPALTDTPGPSLTPYLSPTVTQTQTDQPALPVKQNGSGFPVDWGMFWVGFSVPLLVGSGFVLYILDHKPNFFRPRR